LAPAAYCPQTPDGSDLKTIVNEGRKLPDGLALDVGHEAGKHSSILGIEVDDALEDAGYRLVVAD